MVAITEYSFSWYTLTAIMVHLALYTALYRYIREHHRELHEEFGGRRVWFSMPEQMRFLGFLFGFRYLHEHDTSLSILAFLTQIVGVVAVYLIFAQPIYYRWHS